MTRDDLNALDVIRSSREERHQDTRLLDDPALRQALIKITSKIPMATKADSDRVSVRVPREIKRLIDVMETGPWVARHGHRSYDDWVREALYWYVRLWDEALERNDPEITRTLRGSEYLAKVQADTDRRNQFRAILLAVRNTLVRKINAGMLGDIAKDLMVLEAWCEDESDPLRAAEYKRAIDSMPVIQAARQLFR